MPSSNSRMSDFESETRRSLSSISCTVAVSSLTLRPRMVRPSRVTMRTGRLIGTIARLGSRRDRCIAAGWRMAPTSLRSGAVRAPLPATR